MRQVEKIGNKSPSILISPPTVGDAEPCYARVVRSAVAGSSNVSVCNHACRDARVIVERASYFRYFLKYSNMSLTALTCPPPLPIPPPPPPKHMETTKCSQFDCLTLYLPHTLSQSSNSRFFFLFTLFPPLRMAELVLSVLFLVPSVNQKPKTKTLLLIVRTEARHHQKIMLPALLRKRRAGKRIRL